MIKNCRSYEESVLISRNYYITSVKYKLRTLIDTLLDPVADLLLMTCIYNRAEIWNAALWTKMEDEAFSSGDLERAMVEMGL